MGINCFGTLFVLLNTLKQGYEGDIIFFFYRKFIQSQDHLFLSVLFTRKIRSNLMHLCQFHQLAFSWD